MESSIRQLMQSSNPVQVHLIGAIGAGMTALSEFLADLGWSLTGSDQQDIPQNHQSLNRFVRIHQGHHAGHLAVDVDLVIFSPAIPADNPERMAATQLGVPQQSYDEFVAELTRIHRAFCVAGTHGKTTTAAMLGTILRESNADAGVLVGGELLQYNRSGWASPAINRDPNHALDSETAAAGIDSPASILAVESCEYRRHFLSFTPHCAVVLNVESDHFDCFSDLDDAHNAFREFAARVDLAGLLLLNGDCPNTLQLAEHTDARVETFGFSTTNHWSIQQTHDSSPDRSERKRQANDRLTVLRQGGHFCDVSLSVAGEHNAFNALAAIALAAHAGVSAGQISAAISQFRGVRRRFELVGSRDGVTVISDYAHHPTAIRATIETARSIYPERRIVCLFEPHQISRTVSLLDDFVDSLSLADDVTLGPIFTARENSDGAIEAQLLLLQGLERQNTSARAIASLDQAVSTLDDVVECGDVLLIMGAGNVESIPKQFLANFDHLYSKQTS